jgi:MHS family proline/betaine transporter-like MFS transporter
MAGNVMEWYDFALFGYFAPVIAQLFFPADHHLVSLVNTFGVFAAGFLMRPVGAVMFGYVGDTMGRKTALAASVILMAIPTCLIGLLPTYQQIGAAAPILLTLCRLLQGLSVGGEYTGSLTFLVESAPPGRRGFIGSWTPFSSGVGTLLGSGVGALLTSDLSHEDLYAWGWRIPFLLGLVVGLIGLYLRTGIAESPDFEAVRRSGDVATSPVREALTHCRKEVVTAAGLSWLAGGAFYILFVYMTTYLESILKQPLGTALMINTISLTLMVLLLPVMGALSDRVGRKPLLAGSALGFALFSYPLLKLLAHDTFAYILSGQIVFAVLIAAYYGPLSATLVELFPARQRYSGLSIAYNLSVALFGGSAPLVATLLIKETGSPLSPSIYLILCALISLVVVLGIRESSRAALR